ncbi:hypothetical protein [Streptomyces sp. BH104]|uniref:hypothetical protein n=1 Tax=Streptomyces sp. BH104 TaxID=3410407 RepID=UPI003BB4C124
MKADDILNQIDQALDDWTSSDAMRSRPAGDAETEAATDGIVATSGQIWLAPVGTEIGDDGWRQFEGVRTIEIVETLDTTAELEAFTRSFQAAAQASASAFRQGLEAVAHSLQQMQDGFQGSEWADTNGNPVQPPERPRPPLPRRDGRPAWQTPYGPARRRR